MQPKILDTTNTTLSSLEEPKSLVATRILHSCDKRKSACQSAICRLGSPDATGQLGDAEFWLEAPASLYGRGGVPSRDLRRDRGADLGGRAAAQRPEGRRQGLGREFWPSQGTLEVGSGFSERSF